MTDAPPDVDMDDMDFDLRDVRVIHRLPCGARPEAGGAVLRHFRAEIKAALQRRFPHAFPPDDNNSNSSSTTHGGAAGGAAAGGAAAAGAPGGGGDA